MSKFPTKVIILPKVQSLITGVTRIEQYSRTGNTKLFYIDGTTQTVLFDETIETEDTFKIIDNVQYAARLIHNMGINTKD